MMSSVRKWATNRLRQGDLTALASVARGAATAPEDERLHRLARRKFVRITTAGPPLVTARGRVALVVRKLARS